MKKYLIIIACICVFTVSGNAQTKVQVMTEQIADLATSLKTLKDGYKTVSNGLDDINGLKSGTFGLHQDYITSLTQVSPAVRDNPKVPVIVACPEEIAALFSGELSWQRQQGILGGDELAYLKRVSDNLLSECSKDLEELKLVIQPGSQMSDDERMKRIDKLYASGTEKLGFARSFTHKVRVFALDRKQDSSSRKVIKKLYGIQ